MSHSGIPGLQEIGQFFAPQSTLTDAGRQLQTTGSFGGNTYDHKTGDLVATVAPAAPNPNDPATAASMNQAASDQDQETQRGMAANMLFGASGSTSSAKVSRAILLGS